MKKIRNLVIGGLQQKIFNLVLFTIIAIVIVFTLAAVYQSGSLTSIFTQTNSEQKEAIRDSTSTVMEAVIDSTMTRQTELEAYIADDLFREVGGQVRMLANLMEDLYERRDSVIERAVSWPDASLEGTTTVQLLTEEGVDTEDPDIAHKIGLFGSQSSTMRGVFTTIDQANSCFVAIPEGVLIIVDKNPAGKYDEDGKLISIPVTHRPWYTNAVKKGDLYFSGLEEDIFTGKLEIVCSCPVYYNGELIAVVGSEVFLDAMDEAIQETGNRDGFVCIIDDNGHVAFSPKKEGVFAAASTHSSEDLRVSANEDLAAFVNQAMKEKTDVALVSIDGEYYYMAVAPISSVGWALVTVIDQKTIHAPVDMMLGQHDETIAKTVDTFHKSARRSQTSVLVLLILASAAALAGALTLANRIVRPLNLMTRSVTEINESNPLFTMKEEYRTDDEIEVLAESFAKLSSSTQRYIKHITKITAEKERIGTELQLANRIQADMLPNIFPPFPERKDIDIFATMNPAKEVGGDFYDFFLIDNDHLAMVMADVSGKGVPAALFMMMSKILVSNNAMLCKDPDEVLARVNDQICKNNEEDMFVTAWLGILTISTGHVVASNAGHEYPIIRESGGQFSILKDRHSFVIGGMPEMMYKKYEFELERGGTLFLYTDGVPETINTEDEMFGTDRMLKVLNSDPEADTETLLANMNNAVREFAGDAPQFDDITMMAVRLRS